MRVLVTHPGIQHAHQLAWALEEAGHLAGFWSGVPIVDARDSKHEFWGIFRDRLRAVPIPASKRRHAVGFPLLRRLFSTVLSNEAGNAWNHRLDHAHDIWVARRVRKLRPGMVVCYENSALHTFRAARAVGAVCVLDAASIHYQSARIWGGNAVPRNPVWVDTQKQQEIDLADAILTCSELAAETYRAAGVPSEKLFPLSLGTDFVELPLPDRAADGPCRFVFVGSLIRHKGIDMLLDIFGELEREGAPATLTLIGGVAEADHGARAMAMGNVIYHPFMPQSELFKEVASHDCLLLPSRFDSFGMVVPEAMAVGVPAIVTDRVGAKCIIEQHPDAGWIVPCETVAIKAQIMQLVQQPQRLIRASAAAKRAARDYSWISYRLRVADTLQDIYARFGTGQAIRIE